MGRGGKRNGSGRKRICGGDEFAKLWIGGMCEEIHRQSIREKLKQKFANEMPDLSSYYDDLRNEDLEARKNGLNIYRRDDYEVIFREYYRIDVSIELGFDELRGYRTSKAGRGVKLRKEIISEVQKLVIERYGEKLSPHTINDCWKKFRSIFPDRSPAE